MDLGDETELALQVLRWLPAQTRWIEVPWDDWSAFRDIFARRRHLAGVPAGVHHFAVVVRNPSGSPVNIIRHKYLIGPDGTEEYDNFGGLTREEREEWAAAYKARSTDEYDTERVRAIADKASLGMRLPPEAVVALRFVLRDKPEPGSVAERFLNDPEGQLDRDGSGADIPST